MTANVILKNLMDIVVDDSQKAAERAIEDAIAGRNKDFRRNGMISFKSFIHGNDTMDKYAETYNRVYDAVLQSEALKQVMKDDTGVSDTNNNIINNRTNTNMANSGNIEFQIELAEQLKKYLQGFQERLNHTIQHYENRYNGFGNVMIENFHSKFEENFEETKSAINALIERINDEDIPTIDEYIEKLENLLY